MKEVKARYVLGLTGTPMRKDGHHPIIYMQCGPIRFNLSARKMTQETPFDHQMIPRFTEFLMPRELEDATIQDVYGYLLDDHERNLLIEKDLIRAVESGRTPLLLTGRTEHLKHFAAKISGSVKNVLVLKGGMGRKQRRAMAEALASVPEVVKRAVLATGSYIVEGFDDARPDTLFLAMPLSWRGTPAHDVGRLPRPHANNRVVQVSDYVDSNAPMPARTYERRPEGQPA